MRVLVLGGYGEFGGRLTRLLIRDNHEVLVAGRSQDSAYHFCAKYGGTPIVIDINNNLDEISNLSPDVVVDAVGPFQSYIGDPYRVARTVLAAGAHYLDLSDDAVFTQGIRDLHDTACTAGLFALSGASSAPALSSAAIEAVRNDLSKFSVIEVAILPGCRAPRGHSVTKSILSQIGEPMKIWRGGGWRNNTGWSSPKNVTLSPNFIRRASLIGAPDLALFPNHFNADSVLFRAGLELKILDCGLTILGVLRKLRLLPNLSNFSRPLNFIARFLESFGSDRGGMLVEVTGTNSDGVTKTYRWTLIAEPGHGPFVPTIPVRAILRNPELIQSGARPCLSELPLSTYKKAMEDIDITTTFSTNPNPTLFQRALRRNWELLPNPVRRLHSVQDHETFSGRARVIRGKSILARCAAWFFRFPLASNDVSLIITKKRTKNGETWTRDFGGRRFQSYLTPSRPGHYRERFWAFNYEQKLTVVNDAMYLPVHRGWFFGIPLPRLLLPGSDSCEFSENGVFNFDVSLLAPITGDLIVRYRGWVKPDYDQSSG